MVIKPIYKQIALGFVTIGVTATTVYFTTRYIRSHFFGKGVGQKEATPKDKNEMEIVFVRQSI